MALDAVGWALEQRPATALQKLILLVLCDAEPRDYLATYQVDELADDACSAADEVIDALDALEGLDLLTWHWRGDNDDGYLGATFHRASPEQRGVSGKSAEALVYVIEGAETPGLLPWSKIGVTMDLERRRRGPKRDTGGQAKLFAAWRLPVEDAVRAVERVNESSARFTSQGANWFTIVPSEMVPYIQEAMKLLRLSADFEFDKARPEQTHQEPPRLRVA